jgi:hypothetical protein
MNQCNRVGISIGIADAALLATLAVSGPSFAGDLPLKVPPAAPPADPFWIGIDYLGWSVKGDHLPPLVTTSPAGTPRPQAGVLGAPGTTVLFGDSSVDNGWRSGGRVQAGYWFDPQHSRGVEISFFDLQDASTGFAASSGGLPILARPFFNTSTGAPDATLVAFPGATAGSIAVNETSRLLGAGALYRQDIGNWAGQRISALIGYRYLHSSDGLSIPFAITALGNPLVPGTSFAGFDSFNATGNFHGVDLGLAGEWKSGPWLLEWRGKIALGANINSAGINGLQTVSIPGGPTATSPGGLLTAPSNIGNFSQTRFAVVPEIALNAGYQIAPRWRLFAGYDVLYWTGVQRADGLIDLTVNPVAGSGPARPAAVFNTSPLVAQGFNFGVRYNY